MLTFHVIANVSAALEAKLKLLDSVIPKVSASTLALAILKSSDKDVVSARVREVEKTGAASEAPKVSEGAKPAR